MEEEFIARRLVALPHGSVEMVRRRDLPPMHAEAIFAATAGEISGPLEADTGFDLVRVIRSEIADFNDESSRDALSDAMFEQWLANQRDIAKIEWFWGPASQP
jgi:parvulin-like peptidyl-prolyl isomerase